MTNGDAHVPGAGSYAEVNGLNMYYEVHGSGEPLILLHGGVGAIEMFGEVLPLLAEDRWVVAADLQAHVRTAIRHPEVVRKLVAVSTPFARDGWYPEVLAGMGQMGPEAAEPMKRTPMYQLYASIAPKPEDWPVLLTKLGQLLGQDYDWSEEVAAIEVPTMIVVGDADSVRTAHAVEFFELLGGGKADAGWGGSGMSNARLAILP